MMLYLCITVILLFGLWLIAVSLFAMRKPEDAIRLIGRFASTDIINFTELTIRGLVGLAFVGAARLSSAPKLFLVIGWALLISAIIIAMLPRRWHSAYAVYWSQKIPPKAVYLLAPFSILAGAYLVYIFGRAFLS